MTVRPNIRVSNAFTEMDVPSLILFSRNVINALTGNSNYTTPNPPLATVTAAIDTLDQAQQASLDRGRQAMIARNAAKAELLVLMRQLAAYVQSHCQNDLEILVSSGFVATKTPSPLGPLPAPATPVVRQGPTSGTLGARTGKVNGAYAYNWRLALASDPETYLQTVQTTAARVTFEGLTPGQIYGVAVNALGSNGASDWTPSVRRMVV
jgi:hypothetical protein